MTRTAPDTRPILLSPTALRPADAALTTFSWSAPRADAARLQVSTDRTFNTLLWDVPVAGLTQLTLDKALPPVEQTYYWRVGGEGAWSAPAAFRAASDDDVAQWEWERVQAQVMAEREDQRRREQANVYTGGESVPHQSGTTTRVGAILWIYLLLVGFSVALGLAVYAAI